MRIRGLVLLITPILAVSFNAHAALPKVVAAAIQNKISPDSFVLSTAIGNTFVYKPANGALVKAKVNCLVVTKHSFPLAGLPTPRAYKEVQVWGSAKAGGKTYRFGFFGVAPVESTVYTVSGFRVGTTSTFGSCGAGGLGYTSSVGAAVVP